MEAVEANTPEPKIEQATKEEKLPTLEEVRHYLRECFPKAESKQRLKL